MPPSEPADAPAPDEMAATVPGEPAPLEQQLAVLETLATRALNEHVAVYEALHERLQDELAGIEQVPTATE